MIIRNILIIISSFLTVVSALPYIVDVVKGKTKPRVVTWAIWCAFNIVACAAAFFDKQYPTAIMLLSSTFASGSIVILGWRNGDKKFERIDIFCLSGVLVGVILWQVFDSPSIAIIAMIIIDLIAGIPTTVHAWKKPHEETLISFFLGFIAFGCTLLVLEEWRITAFAYPLFLFLNTLNLVLIIFFRRRFLSTKKR
ncbi:MAG: hypothetical protein WCQ49_01860 [Candidatus Saccharibacteria bacterium]